MTSDIGIIVTAHNEGQLFTETWNSVTKAVHHVQRSGATGELCVLLDRPTPETEQAVASLLKQNKNFRVRGVTVDFGDVSKSRNFGIAQLNTRYVAIVDGDDLIGENWFSAALEKLKSSSNPLAIVHPEATWFFGTSEYLIRHSELTGDDRESSRYLLDVNPWTVASIAPIEIFRKFPYPAAQRDQGFAFEDWAWNVATHLAGANHIIAPKTMHLVRLKSTFSRNRLASESWCLPPRMGFSEQAKRTDQIAQDDVREVPSAKVTTSKIGQLKTRVKNFVAGDSIKLYPQIFLKFWMVTEIFRQKSKSFPISRLLSPKGFLIDDATPIDNPLFYRRLLPKEVWELIIDPDRNKTLIWVDVGDPTQSASKISDFIRSVAVKNSVTKTTVLLVTGTEVPDSLINSFDDLLENNVLRLISLVQISKLITADRKLHLVATILTQGLFDQFVASDSEASQLLLERYGRAIDHSVKSVKVIRS